MKTENKLLGWMLSKLGHGDPFTVLANAKQITKYTSETANYVIAVSTFHPIWMLL